MNIKIEAEGVACVVNGDYAQVYNTLVKNFGSGLDNIFSERIAGHQYLQWVLPGDGWISLDKADPFMGEVVKQELKSRKDALYAKFGANTAMASNVLSVPSDEYIFYKPTPAGDLDIKLTVWGYRYPERINGGNASGLVDIPTPRQAVSIEVLDNGKAVPNFEFKINGFKRSTDTKGALNVGNLPIGYQFSLESEGKRMMCTVEAGISSIVFDVTRMCTITVKASAPDIGFAGHGGTVNYTGKTLTFTLDGNSCFSTELAIDRNGSLCEVSIEGVSEAKPLIEGENIFNLEIPARPLVEPKWEDEEVENSESEVDSDDENEEKTDVVTEPELDPDKGNDSKEEDTDMAGIIPEQKKTEETGNQIADDEQPEEEKPMENEEPSQNSPNNSNSGFNGTATTIGIFLLLAVLTCATFYFSYKVMFN